MPSPTDASSFVADTVGDSGRYRDPLWRVDVELTQLEQRLLRTWWVRRLALVAHAGAASVVTTQSYSRLEHSLGLLALVAHFAPKDELARTAALLHDVGHPPLSHTIEGLRGVDHHQLGAARIAELQPVLSEHGVEVDDVVAVVEAAVPSILSGWRPGLRLDHLESLVRSGQAHGRTEEPAHVMLGKLRLDHGTVDTDPVTADALVRLIVGEARAQSSDVNMTATGVLRHLAGRLLVDLGAGQVAEIAAMTDPELWARLLGDPEAGPVVRRFLGNPAAWSIRPSGVSESDDVAKPPVRFNLRRLYLDLPSRDGELMTADALPGDLIKEPSDYLIVEVD